MQTDAADLSRLFQRRDLGHCPPDHRIAKARECRRQLNEDAFGLWISFEERPDGRVRVDRELHWAYSSRRRSPSSARMLPTSCVTSSVPRYRPSLSRTAK